MTKTYFYICICCSVLGSIALLIFAISGFFHGAFLSLLFDILIWNYFYLIGKSAGHESSSRELTETVKEVLEDNGRLIQQVETLKAIIDVKMANDAKRHADTEEATNSNI